jgi:hypothetical protein
MNYFAWLGQHLIRINASWGQVASQANNYLN